LNNANAFGGTFAIQTEQSHKVKIAKEPPSKRTTTDKMNGQTIYRQEGRTANMGACCTTSLSRKKSVVSLKKTTSLKAF
jgi:hypothetical protein